MYNSELKLCYVDGCWAYFTTLPIADQWGDDWDSTHRADNAGEPYVPLGEDAGHWQVVKVAFEGNFHSPPIGMSVQEINAGAVAWLRNIDRGVLIFAGARLEDFIHQIESAGGSVYLPRGV